MSEKVISDYNGYDYKKEFWENVDREYEDQADRMAIRRLLPKRMEKFADIGGGYGRLANEYLKRARKVYIFDYSKTELAQAKEIYGDKIETKAGDIYKLPFKDNELDGLMMIRVTHHLKDMPKAIAELYRVLKPGGVAVIEVANKRTLPKWFAMSPSVPKLIHLVKKLLITKKSLPMVSITTIQNTLKKSLIKPVSSANVCFPFPISAAKL